MHGHKSYPRLESLKKQMRTGDPKFVAEIDAHKVITLKNLFSKEIKKSYYFQIKNKKKGFHGKNVNFKWNTTDRA